MSLPRTPSWILVAALALSAGTWMVSAQVFREGIDLVVLSTSVVDKAGRPVLGLQLADFLVFEDGVERQVSQFTGERLPISLGILVDVSDSMYGDRMADARRAIDRFVLDLLRPEDEAFLMVFNHEPELVRGWTQPPQELAGRLEGKKPFGGTSLYDGLMRAAPIFAKRRHQRAGLVIVS
ncbi:MAG: VWA domain-containing protein, partial [Acidobacteria bacterium]